MTDAGGASRLLSPDVSYGRQAKGTVLVVLNSVCGCSVELCDQGVSMALQMLRSPMWLATVFAGMEKSAVAQLRVTCPSLAPTSAYSKMASWCTTWIGRIQEMDAEALAVDLISAFECYSEGVGPSITKEPIEAPALNRSAVQRCREWMAKGSASTSPMTSFQGDSTVAFGLLFVPEQRSDDFTIVKAL